MKPKCSQIMVSAALLLACKVEEQPKTVLRVIDAVFKTAFKGRTKALEILSKQVRKMLPLCFWLPGFLPACFCTGLPQTEALV